MTCWLKLPLAPATLLLLAAGSLPACSSSNPITLPGEDAGGVSEDAGGSGSGNDSGTATGSTDSGSSKPGKGKDAGGSSAGDSSMSCSIPPDWSAESPNAACDACELKNCCASIQSCANDSACTAIFNCQTNCYNNVNIDGGMLPEDAGTDDASASTPQDTCAAACVTGTGASTASQNLFNAQDSCVNGTDCGATAVCD